MAKTIKMSSMSAKCRESNKQFIKNWEFYCLGKDKYIHGYRQAKEDLAELFSHDPDVLTAIKFLGEDEVEVEAGPPGSHQIGQKITDGNSNDVA